MTAKNTTTHREAPENRRSLNVSKKTYHGGGVLSKIQQRATKRMAAPCVINKAA